MTAIKKTYNCILLKNIVSRILFTGDSRLTLISNPRYNDLKSNFMLTGVAELNYINGRDV